MMQKFYTASFHNGGRKEDLKDTKGTIRKKKFQANRLHNIRDEDYCRDQVHIGFKNKSIDEHRKWEKDHVFIDEKPEDAYVRIFEDAVKQYDAKQTRNDRKIGSALNYYEKIKNSKTKVPVYEFIITLGNKDNLPTNAKKVKKIYKEFLDDFISRNPNLEVIGAYYHNDESRDDGHGGRVQGAPHLHVDYIPVSRNRWQKLLNEENKKRTRVNGMDVENSLTEALAGQGFIDMELDVAEIEEKFKIHISKKKYKDPERQAQYDEFMKNRADKNGNTRLLTAQMQWEKRERDCLVALFKRHHYQIKNPNRHRSHLETQDYIESQNKNIQEQNLDLFYELSSRLEGIDEEEKELTNKNTELNNKEKELKQKEKELKSRALKVENAEAQLEAARKLNDETKAYKNDIVQIKSDLYGVIKAKVDSDYTTELQNLNIAENQAITEIFKMAKAVAPEMKVEANPKTFQEAFQIFTDAVKIKENEINEKESILKENEKILNSWEKKADKNAKKVLDHCKAIKNKEKSEESILDIIDLIIQVIIGLLCLLGLAPEERNKELEQFNEIER